MNADFGIQAILAMHPDSPHGIHRSSAGTHSVFHTTVSITLGVPFQAQMHNFFHYRNFGVVHFPHVLVIGMVPLPLVPGNNVALLRVDEIS